MQTLEVSGAVRPIYESLGVKRLTCLCVGLWCNWRVSGLQTPQRCCELIRVHKQ